METTHWVIPIRSQSTASPDPKISSDLFSCSYSDRVILSSYCKSRLYYVVVVYAALWPIQTYDDDATQLNIVLWKAFVSAKISPGVFAAVTSPRTLLCRLNFTPFTKARTPFALICSVFCCTIRCTTSYTTNPQPVETWNNRVWA